MKKEKLFMFGIGDEECAKPEFSDKFELIIGPSKEDHSFLMSKYPYYKKAFIHKKGAFCSDIGRLYILSKNRGLYIDFSVLLGKNVDSFIKKVKKYDVATFRGNFKGIETGVLGSGNENNSFFQKVLSFYEKDISIASYISPVVFSSYMINLGIKPGWEFECVDGIAVFPLSEIRNKNEIGKTSVSTGTGYDKRKYFEILSKDDGGFDWESKFKTKAEDIGASMQVDDFIDGKIVNITALRTMYDRANSKELRHELSKDYKTITYPIKFSERLIGSRLYVFFTFKGLKSKK